MTMKMDLFFSQPEAVCHGRCWVNGPNGRRQLQGLTELNALHRIDSKGVGRLMLNARYCRQHPPLRVTTYENEVQHPFLKVN